MSKLRKMLSLLLILQLSFFLNFRLPASAQTIAGTININSFDVAVNPNTNTVYATEANSVVLIDGATNVLKWTIDIGGEARRIAINPNTNKIYVTNRNTNELYILDGSKLDFVAKIPLSTTYVALEEVAVDPIRNKIYVVGTFNHTVYVIDGNTNKLTTSIKVGQFPKTIAVHPIPNKIYVGNSAEATVSVIDGATNTVSKTIPNFYEGKPTVNPSLFALYITYPIANTVTYVDATHYNSLGTVNVGGFATDIDSNTNLNHLYVITSVNKDPEIIVLDENNGLKEIARFPLNDKAGFYSLAVNPNTNKIYVAGNTSSVIHIIDGAQINRRNFPEISSVTYNPIPVDLSSAFSSLALLNIAGAMGLCELTINNTKIPTNYYAGDHKKSCHKASISKGLLKSLFGLKIGKYPFKWEFTPTNCTEKSCVSAIEEVLDVVDSSMSSSSSSSGSFPYITKINLTPNKISFNSLSNTALDTSIDLNIPGGAYGICELFINGKKVADQIAGVGFPGAPCPHTVFPKELVSLIPSQGTYPVEWVFIPKGCPSKSASCASTLKENLEITSSTTNPPLSSSSSGGIVTIPACKFSNVLFRSKLEETRNQVLAPPMIGTNPSIPTIPITGGPTTTIMQDTPTIPITTNDCNDVPKVTSVMIVPSSMVELDLGFSTSPVFAGGIPNCGICKLHVNGREVRESVYVDPPDNRASNCFEARVSGRELPSLGITEVGTYELQWSYDPTSCPRPNPCVSSARGEFNVISNETSHNEKSEAKVLFDSAIQGLENAKKELRMASRGGRILSKKIDNLIFSLKSIVGSQAEDCEEKTGIQMEQIVLLTEEIERKVCSSSVARLERRPGRSLCIPLITVNRVIPILEDVTDKIDEALFTDEDENDFSDICVTPKTKPTEPEEEVLDVNISKPISGQFIVEFADLDKSSTEIANELESKHPVKIRYVYDLLFKGASLTLSSGQEEILRQDPLIKNIFQDYTVGIPKNSESKETSYPENILGRTQLGSQQIPTGIRWIEADKNNNKGSGCKVTVAVIDSGIDFNHPDLRNNIDVSLSRNCSMMDPQTGRFACLPGGQDDNGHGTHVAGVIAAEDNAVGVVGVAPEAEVVSVKVLNALGEGSWDAIIAGLEYVASHSDEIEIANLSLGGTFGTTNRLSQNAISTINLIQRAVQGAVNSGIIHVVAAGNDNLDIVRENDVPSMFPEVITVSALGDFDGVRESADDHWAVWSRTMASNFGTEVDIIAPGTDILSTRLNGLYGTNSGTSFAAPHVSGTIALFISKNGRPLDANATSLRPLINNIISKPRSSYYSNEPNDTVIEPALYANHQMLK